MMDVAPLKLRAEDSEDIGVISSALQDSIVAVRDIGFLADQRRFALVVNRFRWEVGQDADGKFQRTHCALAFDTVAAVAMRGIDRGYDDRLLSLLSVEARPAAAEPGEAKAGRVEIRLQFAGQAAIRLEVDRILCHLEDVGEPWPTDWCPSHRLD